MQQIKENILKHGMLQALFQLHQSVGDTGKNRDEK